MNLFTSRQFSVVRFVFTTGLAAFLIIFLARKFSIESFAQAWSTAHPGLLSLCFLLGFLTTFLRAYRFTYFFPRPGSIIPLYGCFALMRLITSAMPFRSGELVFLGLLKKRGFAPTIAEAMPVWAFLRASDLMGLGLLTILPLTYFTMSDQIPGIGKLLPLIILGVFAALMLVLQVILKFPTERLPAYLASMAEAMQRGVQRLNNRDALITTAAITLLLWLCMATIVAAALMAFHPASSFLTGFAVGLGLMAFSMLPIHPPMGIGTADAALVFLLHLAGIEQSVGIPIAACMRIVLISLVFVDGAIGSLLVMKKPPATLA